MTSRIIGNKRKAHPDSDEERYSQQEAKVIRKSPMPKYGNNSGHHLGVIALWTHSIRTVFIAIVSVNGRAAMSSREPLWYCHEASLFLSDTPSD